MSRIIHGVPQGHTSDQVIRVKVIPASSFTAHFDGTTPTHLKANVVIAIPATFAEIYVKDGRCKATGSKEDLAKASKQEADRLAEEEKQKKAAEEANKPTPEEEDEEEGDGEKEEGEDEEGDEANPSAALEATKADLRKNSIQELKEMAKALDVKYREKAGVEEIVELLAVAIQAKPK